MRKVFRTLFPLFLFLCLALPIAAQPSSPVIIPVTTAPSGSCAAGLPDQQVILTGFLYSCQNVTGGIGIWGIIGGSGTFTTLSGDATSTATGGATTVVGIEGHAIAAPSTAGYVYWNGSAWIYQTPSGSGTVTTSGSPVRDRKSVV